MCPVSEVRLQTLLKMVSGATLEERDMSLFIAFFPFPPFAPFPSVPFPSFPLPSLPSTSFPSLPFFSFSFFCHLSKLHMFLQLKHPIQGCGESHYKNLCAREKCGQPLPVVSRGMSDGLPPLPATA